MKRAYFEIKENDRLADRTYEMKLTCPDNSHGVTRPGQFINIRLDGFFLRRPISVCEWTETGLTIIYKTVGAGTEAMSQMPVSYTHLQDYIILAKKSSQGEDFFAVWIII